MPEFPHILTSPYTQRPNSPLQSTLSSPASFPSERGDEPDPPDVTNASTPSDVSQDSRPLQPTNEPTTSSDRMPPFQSRPSSPHSFPQGTTCLDNTGTPAPTSLIPSQVVTEESHLLASPPVIEVGATASTQSPTRDPIPEVSDTRQQEPPFMTDGRGRVVWSRSGVKRGSSPSGTCSQDRTQYAAGDRD